MKNKWSKFGERLSRPTGAAELMEDLGLVAALKNNVLLLGGGNPGNIPEIQVLIRNRLAEIAVSESSSISMFGSYSHPKGDIEFRKGLASLLESEYGWSLTSENILLTNGSQTGFFLLFNLLAGEFSDGGFKKILLPVTPEYIGYTDVGLSEHMFVSYRPEIEEISERIFKYRVNFDALQIGNDIAAICVSRPTNPTGNVITDQELRKLDELARDAGIPLVIDSAYCLPFPNIMFTEATPLWNDNVIMTMSLSKLGLPGIRTGIIIAKEELIGAMSNITAVHSLAVSSAGPVIVQPWIDSGEIIEISRHHVVSIYKNKLQIACEILKREIAGVQFKVHVPEGAFFLW